MRAHLAPELSKRNAFAVPVVIKESAESGENQQHKECPAISAARLIVVIEQIVDVARRRCRLIGESQK